MFKNSLFTVILEGVAKHDVSLTYSGSSMLINGVNGKDETISIFAHDALRPEEYEIREGYNKRLQSQSLVSDNMFRSAVEPTAVEPETLASIITAFVSKVFRFKIK